MKRYITLISILMVSLYLYGCNYFGPGTYDFSYHLSGGYRLQHTGDTYICKASDKVIEPNVNGIAWDSNFILVRQAENSKTSYWIIAVNADKIYGPFNEEDFNTKRDELKVDNKLKLEDPAKYKNLDESVKNMK